MNIMTSSEWDISLRISLTVYVQMHSVLHHRIITNFSAEDDGIKSLDVVERLVKRCEPTKRINL